jgi:hypothetical protein
LKLFGFKHPLDPTPAILGRFQKEFFLMTTLGDVPDVAWQIIAVSSWHLPHPMIPIKIAINFILPLKTYL